MMQPPSDLVIGPSLGDAARPCPFCGAPGCRLWLEATMETPDGADVFVVTCGMCGAWGPNDQTPAVAIDLWNARSGDSAKGSAT